MLVGGDPVHSDAVDVVNCSAQADAPGDVGSPRLKFVGQVIVQGLLKSDGLDHVAAALVRRHRFEQLSLSVEDSDPGGSVELVSGKGVKIASQAANVYPHVGRGLGPIQQHRNSTVVGHRHNLLDRVDGPQGIGYVDDGDQLGPGTEKPLVLIQH